VVVSGRPRLRITVESTFIVCLFKICLLVNLFSSFFVCLLLCSFPC
jgi:hypothetical protein